MKFFYLLLQPSSLQTGSLFGGPVASPLNPAFFVAGGAGPASRHVNIHIHTGTEKSLFFSTLHQITTIIVGNRAFYH